MSIIQRSRLQHRLLRHHLTLFVLTSLAVAALYTTRPYRDIFSRVSFATAYPAFVLLAATLLIGPWNILRKQRNPISGDLRRDIGIWAGMVGILHSVIGQNVHLRGHPWLYYFYAQKEHKAFPIRHDLFGFSNYTGAVSCLVLLALLATSNDYALRKLGTPGWKRLQRWNYATFLLAAAHTLGYQASEKQNQLYAGTIAICIAATLFLQTAGYLRRVRPSTSAQ